MNTARSSRWIFRLALVASLAILPGAAGNDHANEHGNSGKDGPSRFRGLDRNNDGKITRDEWRGNDHSFSVHDRNGDGVLSGAEVGEALQEAGSDEFIEIDRNKDGRISRDEWRWEQADFNRMDVNHDAFLSRSEYLGTAGAGPDSGSTPPRDTRQPLPPTPATPATPAVPKTPTRPPAPATPPTPAAPAVEDARARFARLDRNGNGLINRSEWDGDRNSFNQLDDNKNDALSREEFLETDPATLQALFKKHDSNGNGTITRSEWSGDKQAFSRLDMNNDDKLGHEEFIKNYHQLEQNFNGMDRDHNGSLTRQEWRGEKKLFESMDHNHDDQLSLVEFVGVS